MKFTSLEGAEMVFLKTAPLNQFNRNNLAHGQYCHPKTILVLYNIGSQTKLNQTKGRNSHPNSIGKMNSLTLN